MSSFTLTICPEVQEEQDAIDGCEGLAWEHATAIATYQGVSMGTEEFEFIWRNLHDRYMDVGHHMAFIQHLSLRVLNEMLSTHTVGFPVSNAMDRDKLESDLENLARIITSSMVWLYASQDTEWVCDHAWDALPDAMKGVDFEFEFYSTEGNDDND